MQLNERETLKLFLHAAEIVRRLLVTYRCAFSAWSCNVSLILIEHSHIIITLVNCSGFPFPLYQAHRQGVIGPRKVEVVRELAYALHFTKRDNLLIALLDLVQVLEYLL